MKILEILKGLFDPASNWFIITLGITLVLGQLSVRENDNLISSLFLTTFAIMLLTAKKERGKKKAAALRAIEEEEAAALQASDVEAQGVHESDEGLPSSAYDALAYEELDTDTGADAETDGTPAYLGAPIGTPIDENEPEDS